MAFSWSPTPTRSAGLYSRPNAPPVYLDGHPIDTGAFNSSCRRRPTGSGSSAIPHIETGHPYLDGIEYTILSAHRPPSTPKQTSGATARLGLEIGCSEGQISIQGSVRYLTLPPVDPCNFNQ
jgi:hypothetical protein